MKITQERVWAGTEESLSAALEAQDGVNARLAAGNYTEQQGEDKPRLLTVDDGVATITIKGSLNNESGFWNEIFGMTGYPEIREALLGAAQDQSVREILLDIDSGGGAVSGVEDTAKLIRMVNDKVKPITAFTDGMMASAAYWLGSAAGKVYSGKTAMVGSIGVISTHMERSEQLKEAGIGVTVVRAGKYKALANSVEKLTEAGKDQIQQVVDAAYGVFVDHVSTMRGKSYDYTDKYMAQGKEFVGQAAVDAGLVDQITSFDKLFSELKEKSIDSLKNPMDNRGKPGLRLSGEVTSVLSGESEMGKKALTEQDIAALAAGAAIEAKSDVQVEDAASVEPNAESEVTEAQAEAQAEVVEAQTQEVDKTSATVQLLSDQLKAKDEALIQAHVKISKLEELNAEANATHGPLLEIAAKSVSNMRVALGGSAFTVEGLSAVQVLAEHKAVTEQFQSKFKAGGVAAVDATQSQKNEVVAQDALTQARLAAVRFSR
jgi:capsid assembly protease